MPWTEFTALLALGTAMSFSPGPNTTLSTALAANRGLRGAMHFVCSVPLGWGLLLLLCAFGLGALLVAAPVLVWAVKAVGVAYLLWLAFKLSQAGHLNEADASRLNVTFFQGAALQFVNILAWMFALMAFAFFSNLAYAVLGASLRGWLSQGARLLWFNRMMALVLVATAAWMITV